MTYEIDNFKINHNLREILLHGERLNVEPKVYDLIVHLIGNANKAISKEELQDAIWPSLEVSETAITRAIMKARKTLNDAANPINYIQTIHGFGYKFIAEIIEVDSEEETEQGTVEALPLPKSTSVNTIIIYLILLSLVAVGIVYLFHNKKPPITGDLIVLPVDNKINDDDFSWVSLGLMSLTSKVIESKSNVSTKPEQESIKVYEFLKNKSFPLIDDQANDVFNKYNVNYIVASQLSEISENTYELIYIVYHKNGEYSGPKLTGSNPTGLAQQMANQIAQYLPGKISKVSSINISNDVFTNELYSRGKSFQLQGDADKAEKYFELAFEHDKSLFYPRYELAVVKRKQNKLEESKEELESLLKNFSSYSEDPKDKIMLLNSLGVTYLRILNYDSAIEYFQQAFELAKKHQQYKYQSTAAYNLGIIYRRTKDYVNARSKALESLTIKQKNNLPGSHYNTYLIGQIERESGNLDKAEKLFNQAYTGYLNADELRHASTALSGIASLLKKKGRYDEALLKLSDAKELKQKLNDKVGLTDVTLYIIDIYIQIGDITKARIIYKDLGVFITENEISTRKDELIKTGIALDFHEGLFSVVINKINKEAKHIKSRNLDMFKLKSQQQLGDIEVIKKWLENNSQLKSGNNSMMRMYWMELESYYLESHGSKQELVNSYQQRLELSRLMGYGSFTLNILLKLGRTYLKHNQVDEAENILNEMMTYEQNWWQLKVYEALVLNASGQHELAKTLIQQAKEKAQNAWKQENESEMQLILTQKIKGQKEVSTL